MPNSNLCVLVSATCKTAVELVLVYRSLLADVWLVHVLLMLFVLVSVHNIAQFCALEQQHMIVSQLESFCRSQAHLPQLVSPTRYLPTSLQSSWLLVGDTADLSHHSSSAVRGVLQCENTAGIHRGSCWLLLQPQLGRPAC